MWGLHTGSPGGMNGTIYPVFWESSANRKGRQQIDTLVRGSNQAAPGYATMGMRARPDSVLPRRVLQIHEQSGQRRIEYPVALHVDLPRALVPDDWSWLDNLGIVASG